VDVAIKTFNQYGYHALGVDSIIAVAGVAKTTFYRYFETKK
jgi:AcrR family transcriptional regulator